SVLSEVHPMIRRVLIKLGFLKKRNLVFYKYSFVEKHKTSKLNVVNGVFEFNCKWSLKDKFTSLLFLGGNSKLTVEGDFKIYSGAKVYVNEGACLKLGSGYINRNLNLSCFKEIHIGNHVAISENVTIRDSDNHEIIGSQKPISQPIYIGNHVWIGLNVTILKGVNIGEGAVIGAGSLVNSDIPPKSLAVGVPAKLIKTDIS
ncbi:MAG: acyltransferase, partial [Cytophagales bacterium]